MAITHAAIRSRIYRAFNYWVPNLALESWHIQLRFDEKVDKANCEADTQYEEAVINFNLQRIKKELPPTYAAVEELVLHELVHCMAWQESERSVSRITRAFLRIRDLRK